MDWLGLFAAQGTLKSFLQHHSSKASVLQHTAFFMAQLSHPYMTTGKTIALTGWAFVHQVMSLLFNMLSGFVISKLLMAQMIKHLLAMQETLIQSLGQEDPLEKEMATHSSTLASMESWMGEPGRLQSMGP